MPYRGYTVSLIGTPKGPAWWRRLRGTVLLSALVVALFHGSLESQAGSERARFTLTDHAGETVGDEDFLGRYLLVYFGYTYCPDICPTDLAILSEAMRLLGPLAGRVQPLFITLDPERDTVEVMRAYVRHFDPRLRGLTGSPAAIKQLATRYRVQYHKVFSPDRENAAGGADYLIEHSAASYLIGPDGFGLSLYPHGMEAEHIAADIRAFTER